MPKESRSGSRVVERDGGKESKSRVREKKSKKMGMSWAMIVGLLIVSLAWSVLVIPAAQTSPESEFSSLHPIVQFLLFNLGNMILIVGIFGSLFSLASEKRLDWVRVLKSGFGTWLFDMFVHDLVFSSPYAISVNGVLVVTDPQSLPYTAIDTILGYIYSFSGVVGTWLYIAVYVITPIVMGSIAIYLIQPRTARDFGLM